MQRARVDKGFGGNGKCWEQKIDTKGVGVGTSRCIGLDGVSDTVLVNATLSLWSFFPRVADYFFESAESGLDSIVTVAMQVLAALDLGQSWAVCPFSLQ